MCSCLLYFRWKTKIGTKSWLNERERKHHKVLLLITWTWHPVVSLFLLFIYFYVTISPTLEHKQDNKKQTELGTKTWVEAALLKYLFKHPLLFQTARWYKKHSFDAFSLCILLDKKVALTLTALFLITHTKNWTFSNVFSSNTLFFRRSMIRVL